MTTKEIRKIVEKEFEVDLSTVNRQRRFIRARWVYYYLCRNYTKQSLSAIGEELRSPSKPKGFDHATVLWGVSQMENDLEYKQFEYPQEFRNILSVFIVKSGSLLENMISGDDRINALKTDFYKKIDDMVQEFNEKISMMKKECANDVIQKIQKEINALEPDSNVLLSKKSGV